MAESSIMVAVASPTIEEQERVARAKAKLRKIFMMVVKVDGFVYTFFVVDVE